MKPKRQKIMKKEVIIWGGTGQAKLARPIIEESGGRVIAVFDDTPGLKPTFADVPLYQGQRDFPDWIKGRDPKALGFCIAIGNPHGAVRLKLEDQLKGLGLTPVDVVHSSAIIAQDAQIAQGCQILPGTVIGPEVRMGRQCIINSNAGVDHECVLEDGAEVGPGATLCGVVTVGKYSWIGAGATVLPWVKIGQNVIVGAGAVVTKDVSDGTVVVGVPARPLKKEAVK